MHPMAKNFSPRNQTQVDNTIGLMKAECPEALPDIIKIAKERGFEVNDDIAPIRGWGDVR